LTQKLRADAQDNRDRILAAARDLFAEHGLSVGMREVARRSNVGPATLCRRFPTRQALIEDAFAGELVSCRTIVEEACADPDAWRGFRSAVTELTVLNAGNRGFVDAFMATPEGSGGVVEHRRHLLRLLSQLAQRAKDQGRLRDDFTMEDLVLSLHAGRALASVSPARRVDAAHRFARLILDGFKQQSSPAADAI
jgi:AcrR family transcriptional regulator